MNVIGILGYKETAAWALLHSLYGQIFVSKDELEVRFIKLYLEDDILIENWTPELLESIRTSLYRINYRNNINLEKGKLIGELEIEPLKVYRRIYVGKQTRNGNRGTGKEERV